MRGADPQSERLHVDLKLRPRRGSLLGILPEEGGGSLMPRRNSGSKRAVAIDVRGRKIDAPLRKSQQSPDLPVGRGSRRRREAGGIRGSEINARFAQRIDGMRIAPGRSNGQSRRAIVVRCREVNAGLMQGPYYHDLVFMRRSRRSRETTTVGRRQQVWIDLRKRPQSLHASAACGRCRRRKPVCIRSGQVNAQLTQGSQCLGPVVGGRHGDKAHRQDGGRDQGGSGD